MTETELLLAAAVVLLMTASIYLVATRRRGDAIPTSAIVDALRDVGALSSRVEDLADRVDTTRAELTAARAGIEGTIGSVRDKLLEASGSSEELVRREVRQALQALERLRAEHDARKEVEERIRQSAARIESILAGGAARGEAGENLLEEAFRALPPGMIDRDFRVRGKPVEYALVLSNGKRIPIDSKWPAAALLRSLVDEDDPENRSALAKEVEDVLVRRAREVARYIDPPSTMPWAIAAVPDAAFAACGKAQARAYRDGVVIMPYSMTVPYVLALYRLHLQYSTSIDLENLASHLSRIDKASVELERVLENKISRAGAMIASAGDDLRRLLSEITGAAVAMRALPSLPPDDKCLSGDEGAGGARATTAEERADHGRPRDGT